VVLSEEEENGKEEEGEGSAVGKTSVLTFHDEHCRTELENIIQ